MQKIVLSITAMFLSAAFSVGVQAQVTEKKETVKPTTVDLWRQAMPESEQTSDTPPQVFRGESKDNVEGEESAALVEKRIIDLETRLMEGFKQHDAVVLNHLLASDFASAGTTAAASSGSDKTHYIDWAKKNLDLKSYILDKISVRVFQTTAVVTIQYKQQANIAGSPANGDFIATNVWVKRRNQWRMVSRHVSALAKI